MAAFKRLLQGRKPCELPLQLVLAWHNNWDEHVRTIERSQHLKGLPALRQGSEAQAHDYVSWLTANGVPAAHVWDLGR